VAAWAIASAAGLAGGRALAVAVLSPLRETLSLIVPALGATVIVGILASALLTAVASSLFAALVVALYERLGGGSRSNPPAIVEDLGGARRLRGKEILAGVVAAAMLSAVLGWILLGRLREPRPVAVIGHRGAAAFAPENTLSSVERAIEDGADWVEIDVQETADGEVVLLHDSDFMKLAGSPLKIWEGNFEDVRKLDIGSWFGPDFLGEPVATLEEVLLRAKGRARVVIELKYYGHNERLEERVADIVERTGMEDQIAVMSLERSIVEKVGALRPGFRKGLLAATARRGPDRGRRRLPRRQPDSGDALLRPPCPRARKGSLRLDGERRRNHGAKDPPGRRWSHHRRSRTSALGDPDRVPADVHRKASPRSRVLARNRARPVPVLSGVGLEVVARVEAPDHQPGRITRPAMTSSKGSLAPDYPRPPFSAKTTLVSMHRPD
jgi:glycerophosphoryl diester phosphodiesterase